LNQSSLLLLEKLASKTAEESGFEVCSFKLEPENKPIKIQIKIKKNGGDDVSLDDCVNFNVPMNNEIEKSGILNYSYTLEISSEGINENLDSDRDFQTFKGFPIEVHLSCPSKKKKILNGLLHKKSDSYLSLNIKGKITKIPLTEILRVNLVKKTR